MTYGEDMIKIASQISIAKLFGSSLSSNTGIQITIM